MSDLEQALAVCGFEEKEWFALAAIKDGSIRPRVFNNADRAERWLEQWSPESGFNCYITGNPVDPEFDGVRPKAVDISVRRVLLIDVDPVGDQSVMPVAQEIQDLVGGTLVFSGRGWQIWLRVGPGVDCEQLLRGLRIRFKRPWAKLDGTHDASRLMRLPGTVNQKTGLTAKIVSRGVQVATAEIVAGWDLPSGAPKKPVVDPEFARLVYGSDDAKRLQAALRHVSADSRETWLSTGFALHSSNLPPKVARSLWDEWSKTTGAGNYSDDGQESAWGSFTAGGGVTVGSIYHLAREGGWSDMRLDVLDGVTDENQFEPEMISAMALLKRTDEGEWFKLRRGLKDKRELDKRVAKEVKAQKRVILNPQAKIRYVYHVDRSQGWLKIFPNGSWVGIPRADISIWLTGKGMDAALEMSQAFEDAFHVRNKPFSPEYPELGVWNRDGAQLAYDPAPGKHPMWNQILSVLGEGMDEDVLADEWCRKSGITSGAQYLLTWIAALFQRPAEKIAYLFLFSENESTGKSTLHESLRTLMTKGVINAKGALVGNFNGELSGKVLAVVDDFALPAKKGIVHNRVKELVTGDWISIHAKNMQPVDERSHLHWIHTANTRSACPVFDSDTRITVIEVMGAEEKIPRAELRQRVASEGAAFLHTVLNLSLPAPGERLLVPALDGTWKRVISGENKNELENWFSENPHWIFLNHDEILEGFLDSIHRDRQNYWPPHKVRQGYPAGDQRLRPLALWLAGKEEWAGKAADVPRGFGVRNSTMAGKYLSQLSGKCPEWLKSCRNASERIWTYKRPCRTASNSGEA